MDNLLITTIGEYNHLDSWGNGKRNFDIALLNYDYSMAINDKINCDLIYLDAYPSFKYPGIAEMFYDEPKLLRYKYFFMPDEDIDISSNDISTLFGKMRTLNLSLAQPSIEKSDTSFPSWELFIHKPDLDIICTNFVEIMCPLFSRDALGKCLETFPKSNSGWGIDVVWPKLIGNSGNNIAVINSVIAKHTRPIKGGNLYSALKSSGISPSKERLRLMAEYDIKSIDTKTY
jgi:hypothetical protein